MGEYMSRLLQVRRTREQGTRITEVRRERASLNHGDTFILDAGRLIYLWNGDESSGFEKAAANVYAEELEASRCGKSMPHMTSMRHFGSCSVVKEISNLQL